MKDTAVKPSEKSASERTKIRRWILKAVSTAENKDGVTLNYIKKYLENKEEGVYSNPETKLVLKRLLDTGHLVKMDGKYASKTPQQKKSNVSGAKKKMVKDAKSADKNVSPEKSSNEN